MTPPLITTPHQIQQIFLLLITYPLDFGIFKFWLLITYPLKKLAREAREKKLRGLSVFIRGKQAKMEILDPDFSMLIMYPQKFPDFFAVNNVPPRISDSQILAVNNVPP